MGLFSLLVLPGWLVASGCDSSIQAPGGGDSETGDTDSVGDGTREPGSSPDVSDGPSSERTVATDPDATDASMTGPDATDPDATDSDATEPGPGEPLNACGGTGELRWQGEVAELLTPCGPFDEGTLVCGGLDALRCAGKSVAVNICGGQGVLSAEVSSPCGMCGDGTWTCDGEGDRVRCLAASEPNVCGGCAQLDQVPGTACLDDAEEEGAWVCTSPDEQACVPGAANACGGQGALMHQGAAAAPGEPCQQGCGGGVLRCDGPEELACMSDGSGEPENACGGCGSLAGAPGSGCGACEDGVWTCSEGQVFCGGGSNANACGGCDELAGVVGETCAEGLAWGCNGPVLECFVPRDTTVDRNACGGTAALTGAPGDACGTCSAGVLVCENPDLVACTVPNSAQVNACGGCGGPGGRLEDPCGSCGSGRLACDGEELACEGDLGDAAENACGGCADLPGEPDEECGPCRIWVCNDRGGVRCVPTDSLPGCVDLATCASLNCAGQRRSCIEATDMDAACGGCLAGYTEENGACELTIGAPQNVEATRGTRTDDVLVTWSSVAFATGYHVYRNGERATAEPVPVTSWQDALAPAAGPPNAVTGLSATTDRSDGVLLTWDPATVQTSPQTYVVVAVIGDDLGPQSDSVEGYRGAPVTQYEVRIGDGAWQSIGDTDSWLDEAAPSAALTMAMPTASTDREDGIALASAEPTVEPASRSYRLRAVNEMGAGQQAEPVNGSREPGSFSYQWEWAESSTGSFSALAGAVGLTHLDTTVSLDSTRWYRLRAEAPGAVAAASDAVEGRRDRMGLGRVCTSDAQCPADSWCPTDTSERRCSPRPTVGGVEIPFQWVPRGTFTMGSPQGEFGRSDGREAQVEVTLTRDYFVQRTPVTQGQWEAVMTVWNARSDAQRTMSGWSGATPVFGTAPACFRSTSGASCSTSGSNPSGPVERVSWWDAVVYANVLSLLEGLTPCYMLSACSAGTGVSGVGGGCNGTETWCSSGVFDCSTVSYAGPSCTGYRLLTEAEWERAARGGTTTATYGGNQSGTSGCVTLSGAGGIAPGTPLADLAWYTCNSENRTQAVGEKTPNAWGLYDILGNVWEWTWTWFSATHSGGTDPLGPPSGSDRVLRGGSWANNAAGARAARRVVNAPDIRGDGNGFRLARTAEP